MARWIHIIRGALPGHAHPTQDSPLPKYLYHGTSSEYVASILQHGLIGSPWLHVTAYRHMAKFAARRTVARVGGTPIVIRINTRHSALDSTTFTGTPVDMTSSGSIPPECFTATPALRRCVTAWSVRV